MRSDLLSLVRSELCLDPEEGSINELFQIGDDKVHLLSTRAYHSKSTEGRANKGPSLEDIG